MNTPTTIQNTRGVLDMLLGCSVMLLLLDSYFFCYPAFVRWGLTTEMGQRVLTDIYGTGLFSSVYKPKVLALLLLLLSLMGGLGPKSLRVGYASCLWLIGIGLGLYFGSSAFLANQGSDTSNNSTACWYMVGSLAGFVLLLVGGARLSRILPSPFRRDDPFGKEQAGFPQEERQISTPYGLCLPARYVQKKRQRESWINIINARRGVLILGSPGSGKSRFIIEPIIRQLIAKGFALFIYDLKYDGLTRQAYYLFQEHRKAYPPGTQFFSINFSDISRSHRCNVLEPSTLEWVSDALGTSRTILLSLNKIWAHQQGDFFVESPINFVAALVWFLRKYQDGRYCTLPHVIELSQVGYAQLFSVLSCEPEVRVLINPFIEAYLNSTLKMLDGQISGAKIPLGRLASPDVYYVLTGNDFSLDINDPAAPKIFCLGGDPARQEGLAPVLSLFIDRLNRMVNRPGKYPCALVCDEFATVRAYNMTATVATARSNNIIPVMAIQDISQLRTQYSREEADTIMNIAGNLFCGQVGGETARWVSERFPRIQQEKMSVSTNSIDTSINHSLQWEPAVTPATIATLSSGEFVGIVTDDPDKPMELKAFHARLRREEVEEYRDRPALRVVLGEDGKDRGPFPAVILQAFEQVKYEVEMMVKSELARMMRSETLRGFILKGRAIPSADNDAE